MPDVSLRDAQRWMQQRIRHPAAGSDRRLLNPQRGTPGEERLAVYAGGYAARIREALDESYGAIRHVLGDRAFAKLADAYAKRHPSHDYNLSFAGRDLPEFLGEYPLSRDLPFLPDLARLEWLVCQAFHAFDQPPLALPQLATLPLEAWAQLHLIFQPSVGLLSSAWPVRDIWEARTRPREQTRIDVRQRPQRVLVFRRGEQVACELLDETPYRLLEGLLAGRTLGAVCDELAARGGSAELPVAAWFARWAGQGLIAGRR